MAHNNNIDAPHKYSRTLIRPSLLALAFNRQHAGKIALLNIPAGFSWIAWVALLVWGVTGKLSNKLAAKARLKPVV